MSKEFNSSQWKDILESNSNKWKERLEKLDRANEDLKKVEKSMASLGIPHQEWKLPESDNEFLVWDTEYINVYNKEEGYRKRLLTCAANIRENIYPLLHLFIEYCFKGDA